MVNLEFDEDGISRNDLFDLTSFGIAFPKLPVIRYLSCNRIGAEDIYRKKFSDDKNVGINGEYAIYCLDKYKSENVADEIVREPKSYTLFSQVNYWLNYILETSITTEDVVGTDFVKCFYTTPEGKQIRPKNTGAGLSYLISVLVLCLLSDKNDIIVIENPEIHLHPKAQSKVCEFLYFIAKSGRQLFVETHSDHIFNGVRAGIAMLSEIRDRSILFYANHSKYYADEYYDNGKLSKNDALAIQKDFQVFAEGRENGNVLLRRFTDAITYKNITYCEFRTTITNSREFRLFYFVDGNKTVFLDSLIKTTQATPDHVKERTYTLIKQYKKEAGLKPDRQQIKRVREEPGNVI